MSPRAMLKGVLLAIAICGGSIFLAGCGKDPKPRVPSPAERLTTQQLVGQRVVAGFTGSKPPQRLLIAIRQGAVGGVILFGDNVSSKKKTQRLTQKLQRQAMLGKQPYLFVMTDQEGGDVKRLAWAPPKHSPVAIGRSKDLVATAHTEGTLTGAALRAAGVNVNLAPVADVVEVPVGGPPLLTAATGATSATEATGSTGASGAVTGATGPTPIDEPGGAFLGMRSFGANASRVAIAACAFAAGMQNAAVAATMKHFPGLGLAKGNTDFTGTEVTASSKSIRKGFAPYKRCPKVPKLVMIASAKYPTLGIKKPASIDPKTYELLRDTGFKGLTITDAYDTPAIKGYADAPQQAIDAGADLVLFGQKTSLATRAYDKLLAAAQAGEIKKSELVAAAEKILLLKRQLKTGSWSQ